MTQQLQHTGNPTYFVVILLLLSYVMSSAPRYIRDMKVPAPETSVEAPKLLDQVKKLARAYTIAPYQKAWESFQLKGAVAAILP